MCRIIRAVRLGRRLMDGGGLSLNVSGGGVGCVFVEIED